MLATTHAGGRLRRVVQAVLVFVGATGARGVDGRALAATAVTSGDSPYKGACWEQLWNLSVGTTRDPLRHLDGATVAGTHAHPLAEGLTWFPGEHVPLREDFLREHASPGETPADVTEAAYRAMQQYAEFPIPPDREQALLEMKRVADRLVPPTGARKQAMLYGGLPNDEFETWNDGQAAIAERGIAAFNENRAERHEMLKPLLARASGEASGGPRHTVGVITVNSGHIDQLLNMLCSVLANGIDADAFLARVLVFPMDEDALETLRRVEASTGIIVVPSVAGELGDWYHNPQYRASKSEGAGVFGDAKFRVALHWKNAVVMDVIDLGYELFFMDADLAFFEAPWAALADETDGCDVAFSWDGKIWNNRHKDPQSGLLTYRALNSGLYLMRANERTKAMWGEMLYRQNLHNSQQAVLKGVVMRHWWRHDLRVCMLSERFVNGHRLMPDKPPKMPSDYVSMHASWVKNSTIKIVKWRRAGAWYYNERCPIFADTYDTLSERTRADIEMTGTCLQNRFWEKQTGRPAKQLYPGVVEKQFMVCDKGKCRYELLAGRTHARAVFGGVAASTPLTRAFPGHVATHSRRSCTSPLPPLPPCAHRRYRLLQGRLHARRWRLPLMTGRGRGCV